MLLTSTNDEGVKEMDSRQTNKDQKRAKQWIIKGFSHAAIIMAFMMFVFFFIDRVNKPIGFMTNEFHKWLSFLLAVASLCYAVSAIARLRKEERADEEQRIKALRAKRAEKMKAAQGAAERPAQSTAKRSAQRPVQSAAQRSAQSAVKRPVQRPAGSVKKA